MYGIKYLARRRKAKALWLHLGDSSTRLIETDTAAKVELTATFADPQSKRDTIVRVVVRHSHGEPATAELVLMWQPSGISLYCDADCVIQPCKHHEALLEAGMQLDGAAGAAVREAMNNIDRFTLSSGVSEEAEFTDEDRLIFIPVLMRWHPAAAALRPVQVPPLQPNACWSKELCERIPDTGSLARAVTNEAVEQQMENLTALERRVFLLSGPSGSGKSATLARIAARRGVPYLTVNSPEQVELFRVGLESGATVLHHSLLVQAVQQPCVIELVDLHRWADRMDVLDAIEPLLNPTATRLRAYYPITGGAIDVPLDPQALIGVTTNRPSFDFGAKWLERWTVLPVPQLSQNALAEDGFRAGSRVLHELVRRGLAPLDKKENALKELAAFANLVATTVCQLNNDQLLGSRHTWGTRTVREAVERRAFGDPPNEIAVGIFAGKLPRDPALALHALSLVHGHSGWGKPKVTQFPFGSLVSDQQLQAAFPEIGGKVE
ncbi:hypothetical protein GCM10010452_72370 [Crossiella cryophila]